MRRSRASRFVLALVALAALGAGAVWLWASRPAAPSHSEHAAAPQQLWTCGMHPQVIQDRPGRCPICGMELTPLAVEPSRPSDPAAPAGPAALTIDPVIVQKMGVRVAPVTEGSLAVTVRAVGVLEEAEPSRRDVNLRVSGWIERLHADTEGMHLDGGDPLFDLYSPELEAGVAELIASRRARETHPSNVAERVHASATRKLERYGLPASDIARLGRLDAPPRTVTFRSPIRGHLVMTDVVAGARVEAGQAVMRIVDHAELWLDARVFEQDLPLVRMGARARATLTARPGEVVEGEVIFVHPHVDETTRTAMVRLAVPNPALVLRPGMYASVEIAAAAQEATALVPREAVIDTGTRQVAFVALDGGRFEPRELTLGTEAEGVVQVLAGLAPGEMVVTSGNFLLDAESRTREAVAKHLERGLVAPPSEHEGH